MKVLHLLKFITTLLALVFVIIIGLSCTEKEPSSNILDMTKEKITNNRLATYNYESFWDNRFNDSEFRDTNYIELERSKENLHGLVFHISDSSYVDFFDGVNQREVDHSKGIVINHDSEKIALDSTYFMFRMNLMAKPSHFLDIDSTYASKDSIIEGKEVVIFTSFKEEDYDSEIFKTVSSYMIDKSSYKPWMIKTTTIKEKDTSQVLTHYFQNLKFSNNSIDFSKLQSHVQELGYAEITSNQMQAEYQEKQIQIGSKVPIDNYENILGEETKICGRSGKRTVLMFSFIGCGGCKYAMKEMKKKNFEYNEDIDFYYSSPVDKNAALEEYLSKQGFDGIGFGKESKMNESFNAYSFPTFFIIDSSGTLTNVYHGYSDGFEDEIF